MQLLGRFTVDSPIVPGIVATAPPNIFDSIARVSVVRFIVHLLPGIGGNLDVYLQWNLDGTDDWFDLVHFPQVVEATAVRTYSVSVPRFTATGPDLIGTNLDPQLATGQITQGLFGRQVRAVFEAGAGTTGGGPQTFSAYAEVNQP